jgi:hypothetical protein
MTFILSDRVKENTTTTGTGTVTLAGADTSFATFGSALANTDTTYYAIVDSAAGDWEVGIGTYTVTGTTLSRDTVLESSNADALVNFAAGDKSVFITYPADKSVYLDTSGNLILTGNLTCTDLLTIDGGSTAGNVNIASTSTTHWHGFTGNTNWDGMYIYANPAAPVLELWVTGNTMIEMFGTGHAQDGDIDFYGANLLECRFDKSASTWDFQANAITTTGNLTCAALTSTGIDDNATSVAITIDATEQVGINRTAPDSILHIRDADPILIIQDTETGGANVNARLRIAESGAASVVDNYIDFSYEGSTPSGMANGGFIIESNVFSNMITGDRTSGNIGFSGLPHATDTVDVTGGLRCDDLVASGSVDADQLITGATDVISLNQNDSSASQCSMAGATNFHIDSRDTNSAIYLNWYGGSNGVFIGNGAGASTGALRAGAITATSYGGITEANLVDKTASETISGIWDFSANSIALTQTAGNNTTRLATTAFVTTAVAASSGGTTWLYKTTSYTIVANEGVVANISSGTITLPATIAAGDPFIINNKHADVLTIADAGHTIQYKGTSYTDNVTLAQGETIHLVATTTALLEIV